MHFVFTNRKPDQPQTSILTHKNITYPTLGNASPTCRFRKCWDTIDTLPTTLCISFLSFTGFEGVHDKAMPGTHHVSYADSRSAHPWYWWPYTQRSGSQKYWTSARGWLAVVQWEPGCGMYQPLAGMSGGKIKALDIKRSPVSIGGLETLGVKSQNMLLVWLTHLTEYIS